MRTPSICELLSAWECSLDQPPVQRALTLLATAYPDTPPPALAELTIGQRDARLLTLRESIFGPHLVSLVACPDCGEVLELCFDVADVRVVPDADPAGQLTATVEGYLASFRLPTSADLMATCDGTDHDSLRHALLERCLQEVVHEDTREPVNLLPAQVERAIVERMAQHDGQADVKLDLTCSVCTRRWKPRFDILSFLWAEIDAWASRTLREVNVLASVYGWSEGEILALSPRRRRIYLEMASA